MRCDFDTSLLVGALIRAAGTAAAKTYLTGCGDEPRLISRECPITAGSRCGLEEKGKTRPRGINYTHRLS